MAPPIPREMDPLNPGPAGGPPLPDDREMVRNAIERRGGEGGVDAYERLEKLARQRFLIDPDKHSETLRELDRQCEEIIRTEIPYLAEAVEGVREELQKARAAEAAPPIPGSRIPPP